MNVAKQEITVSHQKANLYSMLIGLVAVSPFLIAYVWNYKRATHFLDVISESPWNFLLAMVIGGSAVVLGTILHEAIHGLSWVLLGRRSLNSVEFGFSREAMMFYAHLKEPIGARVYRIGIVMPGLLLGILPALAGALTGNVPVLLFGMLFIVGAGGDFLVLWLIRGVAPDAQVEDHPSKVGCYVLQGT